MIPEPCDCPRCEIWRLEMDRIIGAYESLPDVITFEVTAEDIRRVRTLFGFDVS